MTDPTPDPLEGIAQEYDAGGTNAQVDVTLNVDATPWRDLTDKPMIEVRLDRIGALPAGMVGGRPSVAIVAQMADGTYVLAQTSLRVLMTAATVLGEHYRMLGQL